MKDKVEFVYKETLKIHQKMPESRIASSLSPIEIFVALFYGDILNFDPKNPLAQQRDRFIISKGHGSISMYPILADLGFFDKKELENVGNNFLGSIPDPLIPGYETINGSLGHGLGVGCGIAKTLQYKKNNANVVVLVGDGELNEGSIWEAIMFASTHKLDNLTLIIDNNKISMLDRSKNIIDLEPLEEKFKAFGWDCFVIKDAHNVYDVHQTLQQALPMRDTKPKVVIAHTKKAKGLSFEDHPLSHIFSLSEEELKELL